MTLRSTLIGALALLALLPGLARAEPQATSPEQARLLMDQGRAAILREDYPAAIRAFEDLLSLPTNAYSRDALEFLGLASERNGDIKRARDSYERYLTLYPEGEDAQRMRQRLSNLPVTAAARTETLRKPRERKETETLVYGGLSQTYYRGNTRIDNTTTLGNFVDQSSLSLTDQSQLVTSFDLTMRERGPTHETRYVIRDIHTLNFLTNGENLNRLTAAYVEHRNKPSDFLIRLGRQPALGGGVMGRYDGGQIGYGINPAWRVNLVYGEPVEYTLDANRHFLGVNTDIGAPGNPWSGNLYLIQQTVDGIPDREAVGAELRHFTPTSSVFTLLDYDTLFSEPNIALLQGYWQLAGNDSFNLLVDLRRSPSLQTLTAVTGETTSSISALLQTYTAEDLVNRASALSATSKMFSAGYNKFLSKSLQLGSDFRVTRTSATLGTNNVPAMPDSNNMYTLTEQLIATGLIARRDVTVISASVIRASPYDGLALAFTNRSLFGKNWSLDASLRWYKQTNEPSGETVRITPTLRTTYRWKENVAFEFEIGVENTETTSPTVHETNDREFFSLGYRWDF
jgi:hypothetical protein